MQNIVQYWWLQTLYDDVHIWNQIFKQNSAERYISVYIIMNLR